MLRTLDGVFFVKDWILRSLNGTKRPDNPLFGQGFAPIDGTHLCINNPFCHFVPLNGNNLGDTTCYPEDSSPNHLLQLLPWAADLCGRKPRP
jgi:hypothetical protein